MGISDNDEVKIFSRRLKGNSVYFTKEGFGGLMLKVELLLSLRGITRSEFAECMNTNKGTLSTWFNGNALPSKVIINLIHQWTCSNENVKTWKLAGDIVGDMKTLLPNKLGERLDDKNFRKYGGSVQWVTKKR